MITVWEEQDDNTSTLTRPLGRHLDFLKIINDDTHYLKFISLKTRSNLHESVKEKHFARHFLVKLVHCTTSMSATMPQFCLDMLF